MWVLWANSWTTGRASCYDLSLSTNSLVCCSKALGLLKKDNVYKSTTVKIVGQKSFPEHPSMIHYQTNACRRYSFCNCPSAQGLCTLSPQECKLLVLIDFCPVYSKLTWSLVYKNFWYFTKNYNGMTDLGWTFPHCEFLSLYLDMFDQNWSFLQKYEDFDKHTGSKTQQNLKEL